METAENAYKEVKRLEEKGLISLKWIQTWVVLIVVVFISLFCIWSIVFPKTETIYDHRKVKPMLKYNKKAKQWYGIDSIHISMVITCPGCTGVDIENKLDSVICTLKSVYVFSRKVVHFHLFADDAMYHSLLEKLEMWSPSLLHRITFTFKSIYGSEAPEGFNLLTAPLAFYYLNELMVVEPGTIITDYIDPIWEDFLVESKKGCYFIATTLQQTTSYICQKSQYITTDQMILDNKVVLFNLKKLRKAKLLFPSDLHNKHFNKGLSPLVGHMNNYYNWTAETISKFQTMLSNNEKQDVKSISYTLNLIALFNPKTVTLLKEKVNVFNFFAYKNKTKHLTFFENKTKDENNHKFKKVKNFLKNIILNEIDYENKRNHFLKCFYKLILT